MATSDQRLIADNLFELREGEPTLIGSRCTRCTTVAFPQQSSCPRCTAEAMERHPLARTGTLWTWTTQGFRPKTPPYSGPAEFTPYAVGYVELGGEIRVEGLLCDTDPGRLAIGMPMRVVARDVSAADGSVATTFAFAAIGDDDAGTSNAAAHADRAGALS